MKIIKDYMELKDKIAKANYVGYVTTNGRRLIVNDLFSDENYTAMTNNLKIVYTDTIFNSRWELIESYFEDEENTTHIDGIVLFDDKQTAVEWLIND